MRLLKERGLTLVVVLLLVTLMAILAGSMLAGSGGISNSSHLSQHRERALYAAEAGCLAGLVEINRDPTWNGFTPPAQVMPNGLASYQTVTFQAGDTTPTGAIVPANMVYILSTGTSTEVQRQVGIMVRLGVGSLDYAVLAKESIFVNGGSVINSVDPLTDLPLPNPANVATQAILSNSIQVLGGSSISGDAEAGIGAASDAVSVAGGSSVGGTIGEMSATIPIDDVVLPADPSAAADLTFGSGSANALPPGVYGDLIVEGGATLTIDPGEYTFSSVIIRGGGTLELTGPVDLYADNSFEIRVGSIVNPSRIPSDFKVFVEDGPVDIVSGGTGYYVLYAPKSVVTLDGNGTVYGNLIGQQLIVDSGSSVHFDPNSTGAALPGGGTTTQIVTHQTF